MPGVRPAARVERGPAAPAGRRPGAAEYVGDGSGGHLAAATGRLPHLTSWLAHPSGPSPEEQFSLGLGFLLDGIARCLTGAENPARSDKIGP